MLRRHRTVLLPLLAALLLLTSGCPKDPYRASLQGSDDVAKTVHAAIVITSEYYNDKLVDDSEKAVVGNVLMTITSANTAFRTCVVAAHGAKAVGQAPFLACADVFVQQASAADPTTLGFKNPKAQSALKSYLQAVKLAVNGIGLAIQSAKGGQ